MRRPVIAIVLLAIVLLAGSAAPPAAAAPQVPAGGRVSVSSTEVQANGESFLLDYSDNGRFVLFGSEATNLVAGDSNDSADLFVRDTVAGTTQRVSVGNGGVQADDDSFSGSISDDGRFVAFSSGASNLYAGDTLDETDVFVRDRTLGTTEVLSVGVGGVEANGGSFEPAISGDGTKVSFASTATNLIAGDTLGFTDVFLRDLTGDTTERVSISATEGEANGDSRDSEIDQDGNVVVFLTEASNLIGANDTNGFRDAYARQLATDTTIRVSVGVGGVQGDGDTSGVHVSDTGSKFAFQSDADNFVPDDGNGQRDVFARSILLGGTVERVSVDTAGADLDEDAFVSDVSSDGDRVVFETSAPDVGGGGSGGVARDVLVRDIVGDTTTAMSRRTGVVSNGLSSGGAIADDGRVAFDSAATNLVAGDTNGVNDAFLSGEVCDGQVVNVDLNKGQVPTGLADVILGTPGPDTVNALGGNDRFCGAGGNDVFRGGTGNDRAFGGPGVDTLRGEDGTDRLDGAADNDKLFGGNQADVLVGVSGADLLEGGNGNDTLNGGTQADTCRGQVGTDTAVACEAVTGVP